jgi:SIR2-like domain
VSEPLFLLGAGASVDAGLPRGGDLTNQVLEHMRAMGHGARAATAFHAVACLLAKSASQNPPTSPNEDPNDFERVLEALSLLSRKHLQVLEPLLTEWNGDLRDAIAQGKGLPENAFDEARATAALVALPRVLELKDSSRAGYLTPLLEPRDGARRVIATVNYDNAIEIAASDCFPRIALETCIVPHGDTLDCWNRNRRIVPGKTGVSLLKLHGSVTWRYTDSRIVGSSNGPQLIDEIDERIHGFPAPDESSIRDLVNIRDPALIYDPVAKLGGPGPFVKLLGAFQDELWATDALVIIGYSFRDDHINSIIWDWSGRGPKKIIIVNGPGFAPDRTASPWAFNLDNRLGARFVNTGLRAADGIARFAKEEWWPAADGGS